MNETTLSVTRFPRIWSAWFIIDDLLLGWAGAQRIERSSFF